jgi:hypothetical protein
VQQAEFIALAWNKECFAMREPVRLTDILLVLAVER